MTMYLPTLPDAAASGKTPKYLAIAEAISTDISNGTLSPGDRMPTHRDLAFRIGVTVGTVSRAYGEIARRGLTSGEVGRGTFVAGSTPTHPGFALKRSLHAPDLIEMSMNWPTSGQAGPHMARTLAEISRSNDLDALSEYQSPFGLPHHREAGAALIGKLDMKVDADDVIVTNGGQHGMTIVFTTVLEAGDLMVCENLTYPAMKALARSMNIRLKGLRMDDQGIIPEHFEEACRSGDVKALYTMPTIQNPTCAMQGDQRRRDIAAIARQHGVIIIEDDVYGFLTQDRPPPLSTYAPEISYYLSSTAKSIAPGLRVGYVVGPSSATAKLAHAVQFTSWMTAPLMAEIVSRWVVDGTADTIIDWHRENARFRNSLGVKTLAGYDIVNHPEGYHLWLTLPYGIEVENVLRTATGRGIALTPPDVFTIDGDKPPNAVRVCLGAPQTMRELEKGLLILRDILDAPGEPNLALF
ncbi:MAG: MocR-like ectoine utilization transcription factor EhuR [Alphaproteobacteria bacterium]